VLQYLIRHGESVSNAAGRVQGQEDVELSVSGREQARAVAAWSRTLLSAADAPPVDELWSSPLRRARETAEAIAAATGLPLRIDERLRELHAGICRRPLPRPQRSPRATRRATSWASSSRTRRASGGLSCAS
jgi:broad specificity phosphatase PhoE